MLVPAFDNDMLSAQHDGAVFDVDRGRLALTTDTFVVRPRFFPGGDIGSLSVYGTVNDLAMCGAKPLHLTVGLVLEEGLEMEELWRIVTSMAAAARRTGVTLVTGDTKVVERGSADGIYVNTAGVGTVVGDEPIAPASVREGDAILLSGDIGRHGMAIMAARDSFSFETRIESDSAPLDEVVLDMLSEGIDIHCMRDLTRGGLASALIEIGGASGLGMRIREDDVPVEREVRGACEILGLDPLYVANEGRFVCMVAAGEANRALAIMRRHDASQNATAVGEVKGRNPGFLVVSTAIGSERVVDMLSGEQLPRIC